MLARAPSVLAPQRVPDRVREGGADDVTAARAPRYTIKPAGGRKTWRPGQRSTIVPAQDTQHDGAEHEQMPQQACLRWETRARMLHGLEVKVPDTVLFEAGEPVRWLFTSQQTGVVLAKKRSRLNETDILRAFGRSAKGGFVAVARSRVPGRKRLRIEFLRSYQVLDLLRDTKQLRSLESLQVCAGMHAERGFSAYEVSYVAGSRTSVWRVTDDMRVMGVKSGRSAAYEAALERYRSGDSRRREVYRKQDEIRVVSQAKTSNEALVDAAQKLVRALEKRLGRGRVATLTAEFIETRDAGLILTHVAELTLADGPVTDVSLLSQLGLGVDDNGSLSSGRSSDHASVASGLAEETATTSQRSQSKDTLGFSNNNHNSNNLNRGTERAKSNQSKETGRHDGQTVPALSLVLAGPRRGQNSCWGQFCLLEQSGERISGKQILLAAVARAAARRVELRRDGISFRIAGFASKDDKNALEALQSLRDKTSRLYRPVPVCDICFAAYRFLHDSRARWDVSGADVEFEETDCLPGMSRNSLALALGTQRDVKLFDSKSRLSRAFFACDRHGVTETPKSGCCARCNRLCFEQAAAAAAPLSTSSGGEEKGRPLQEVVQELVQAWAESGEFREGGFMTSDEGEGVSRQTKPRRVPPPPPFPPPAHLIPRPQTEHTARDAFRAEILHRYEGGKRGSKGRSAKASLAFELQTGETPEKMRRAVVSKSHRVERLQQMLSSAVSHAQGWHPPLIAIRRKSFIPATPSK